MFLNSVSLYISLYFYFFFSFTLYQESLFFASVFYFCRSSFHEYSAPGLSEIQKGRSLRVKHFGRESFNGALCPQPVILQLKCAKSLGKVIKMCITMLH